MNDHIGVMEVINRYFAALDMRTFDAATFARLFVDGATVIRPNGMSVTGPEAIRSSHTKSMERFRATQHLTSGFVIDTIDEATADFRVNLVALHLWQDGCGDATVSRDDNYFLAGGVVSGRATRTSAGWRIVTVRNDVVWRKGVGFQEILNTR